MGVLKSPQPVLLIMGVLYGDRVRLDEAESRLAAGMGEIEVKSQAFDFDVTGYYEGEMGPDLKRVFLAFKNLIDPGNIVDIKLAAVGIEEDMSVGGRRTVNLDPGYMDFNKLVLVSAKFLANKIYIGRGVYADPTMYYDKGWITYEWAFPDFRSGRYSDFFAEVRDLYKRKMRQSGGAGGGQNRQMSA